MQPTSHRFLLLVLTRLRKSPGFVKKVAFIANANKCVYTALLYARILIMYINVFNILIYLKNLTVKDAVLINFNNEQYFSIPNIWQLVYRNLLSIDQKKCNQLQCDLPTTFKSHSHAIFVPFCAHKSFCCQISNRIFTREKCAVGLWRCLEMNIFVELLIDEVREKTALYNKSLKKHSN